MKAITIRGVEPPVSEKLKATAKKQGKSINQLLLDIIKQSLGLQKEKQFTNEHDDLDDLFGRWSDTEFETIQSKITAERHVDQELWR